MSADQSHGRNRPNENDPLSSSGRIEKIRYILEELATFCPKIEDEKLRHLLVATIELRSSNPELLCHDSDLQALAMTVALFLEGPSQPPCDATNAAGILAAVYKGAASVIESKELTFDDALYLLNEQPQAEKSSHLEANGFAFAVQYGGQFTPKELFTAFSNPDRDPLAEHLDDREMHIISLFKIGYARLSIES
jgi:hypothetical protein